MNGLCKIVLACIYNISARLAHVTEITKNRIRYACSIECKLLACVYSINLLLSTFHSWVDRDRWLPQSWRGMIAVKYRTWNQDISYTSGIVMLDIYFRPSIYQLHYTIKHVWDNYLLRKTECCAVYWILRNVINVTKLGIN